jgi:osmotically-inducible protein OsmY
MTGWQLHEEVLAELEFEPQVNAERIGVAVDHGVVSLSGQVDSYAQKLAAERAVKRVYSARAVVNDLEVRLPSRDEVSDADLATAAVVAVDGLSTIPPDSVRLTVRHGHVILEGIVDWNYQSRSVERAIHHLRGVRAVRNQIRVRHGASPSDVKDRIEAAPDRPAGALKGIPSWRASNSCSIPPPGRRSCAARPSSPTPRA